MQENNSISALEVKLLKYLEKYKDKLPPHIDEPIPSSSTTKHYVRVLGINDETLQKMLTLLSNKGCIEGIKLINKGNRFEYIILNGFSITPEGERVLALADNRQILTKKENMEDKQDKKVFWLTFDDINNRLLLNDIFIMAKPKHGSDTYNLIKALTENTGQYINAVEYKVSNLQQSIAQLGFIGVLRQMFIETGKGDVKLHNPVLQERYNKLENKEQIKVTFTKTK